MSRGIVTLLTDFGTADPYVGAMRGAALAVNPDAQLVDITHEIAPHDVAEAGFVLAGAFRFFPPGTVHVAVVDPGVGSERRLLAAEFEGHRLLAPDNGLLSLVFRGAEPTRLVSVTNAAYFRQPVSPTFHGRDIFAPVAAHLTLGVDMGDLGPPVGDYVRLDAARPRVSGDAIEGVVVHVDRFGNLVTNIAREDLGGRPASPCVQVGSAQLRGLCRTYADVAVGELLAVIGSGGFLEVSANQRSAAAVLGVGRGAPVRIACGR
jgi:hypothetical protein